MPLIKSVGTFKCIVQTPKTGWFDQTSKGTKYIKIVCQVDDPASHEHGNSIVWNGYLSIKAIDGTEKQLVKAFGDDWTWAKIPFSGMQCEVVTEEEEYNGKKSIKAKYINAPGKSANPQSERSPEEAKRFSAEIARSLPARNSVERVEKTITEDGDDIPF
jgi:hypothetical protein